MFNYVLITVCLIAVLISLMAILKLVRFYSFRVGHDLKEKISQGNLDIEDDSAISTVLSIVCQNSNLSEKALEGRVKRYKKEVKRALSKNSGCIGFLTSLSYFISLLYSAYNLSILVLGLNDGISYSEMVLSSFNSIVILLVVIMLIMPFYMLNSFIEGRIDRIAEEIENSASDIILMVKEIR